MSAKTDLHILTGIDELTKPWRDGSRNDFENIPLKQMYRCIHDNFKPSRSLENLSEHNWRFTKETVIGVANSSPEKRLEKKISSLLDPRWVNQVPAASGFRGSGGRKRSIDLVFEPVDSVFVFYELKVLPKSGSALDATFELLGYGLLYIYSRRLARYKEHRLMKAHTVQLRVLGTWKYYDEQRGKRTGPSKQLQDAVSLNLNQLASDCLPECKMDFGFDTFPKSFSWPMTDGYDEKRILVALAKIHPLFT
jgi:hypothetical protein